ncbi:Monooxygenase [Fusarium oxysporum f. sp. vasinfectum]|nr:Monooxygenase [Fusarium oxysporum f. sp. vasinfectum]
MAITSLLPPSLRRPLSNYAQSANLGSQKSYGGFFSMYEYHFSVYRRTVISITTSPESGLCIFRILPRGEFSEEPADADVCVIILAARSNHPLGMFAPNYKTLFEFGNKNVADLEANAPENGYLGMPGWLQAGDRLTGSEAMVVGYFKDVSNLHKFAQGSSHRNGWNWWNSIVKDNPHLGIMHEVYMVPKNHWESIYINYHRTVLAATNVAIPASVEKPGQTMTQEDTIWVAPIVESRNGVWKSSKGRMGLEESGKIRVE